VVVERSDACSHLSPHLEGSSVALSLSLSLSHLLAARLGNAERYRDRLAEVGRAVRRNGR